MSLEENKFMLVKIPKQDFMSNKVVNRQLMDDALVNEMKEIFALFAENGLVNPHSLKNGLRSVSNKILIRLS